LLGTPFDPYAYTADVRPPAGGAIRVNLPNVAIFLWRLIAYRPRVTQPVFRATTPLAGPDPGDAKFAVRFDIHPLGIPVRLFNTARYNPDTQPPVVTEIDEIPNPIPMVRLSPEEEAGNPAAYVSTNTFNNADPLLGDLKITAEGLQFHFPVADFPGDTWTFRGAN